MDPLEALAFSDAPEIADRILAAESSGGVEDIDLVVPAERSERDASDGAPPDLEGDRDELERTFEKELLEIRRRLRGDLADERLRGAIGWLSPSALMGIEKLISDGSPASRNKKARQRELVAAMYEQRLRAKNDTIGFFGPREVATVGEGARTMDSEVQDGWIERCEVFFEHWAMVALARRIAADRECRPFLKPRRSGWIRVEDDVLHYPVGRRQAIELQHARLLSMADGTKSIAEMQTELVGDGRDTFHDEHELNATLEAFERRGLLCSAPVVPTCVLRPDRYLRAEIGRTLEGSTRERWLERLDALERGRSALERASSRELADARGALEASFEASVDVAASRAEGELYGARRIAYLDCAGSRRLEIGTEMLRRLAPVELVFESLRAYSARVGARFDRALDELHARLSDGGGPDVDWTVFVTEALESALRPEVCREVIGELRDSWRAALDLPEGARRVERDLATLRGSLAPALAADGPGWPTACFNTVDVMMGADDAAAVARGDYRIVLGEVHPLRNMVFYPVALSLHPGVLREAAAAYATDVPGVVRPNVPEAKMMRAAQYLPADLVPVTMIDGSWPPPAVEPDRLISAGDLVVRRAGDGSLHAVTRDGRFTSPLRTAMSSYIASVACSLSLTMLDGAHIPRVTVDGVVLLRESWRVGGPVGHPGLDGWLAARRWAATHGMPRWIFVRSETGAKPFLVDLDNPFLVEALLKESRRRPELRVSEMLPTPDELWMRDGQGRRYTSELRLCVVDPRA